MDDKSAELIAFGLDKIANAIHNLASAVRESYLKEGDKDIRKASALEHVRRVPEERPEEPIPLDRVKRQKPMPKVTVGRISQRDRRKQKNAGHGKGGAP